MGKKLFQERIKHEREIRELTERSVEKERSTQFDEYARRLADLNHAHERSLIAQAATVPREMFDTYVRESNSRTEVALKSITEKYDSAIANTVERHDKDFTSVRNELQVEREIRKVFEGGVSTWKWIAGFLGASGVVGVLALFITRT